MIFARKLSMGLGSQVVLRVERHISSKNSKLSGLCGKLSSLIREDSEKHLFQFIPSSSVQWHSLFQNLVYEKVIKILNKLIEWPTNGELSVSTSTSPSLRLNSKATGRVSFTGDEIVVSSRSSSRFFSTQVYWFPPALKILTQGSTSLSFLNCEWF